ncbi:uncharacterized protein BCR38DRAFT_520001 [Pseudomassariella vexata]|uniref:Rhodopsin domain-containing protein n=1 Tax=Pseudomassariella vexata TaxID=1141098 RepID=A0A1Y2EK32_9PEZI|nr:uncharacterized protein BCR38DRAFT_520001 [Pseudomassariella vexata]ORY71656.1 hypothetical protein BCR38DRAFT_520001 [Pseudomassariella vexata]
MSHTSPVVVAEDRHDRRVLIEGTIGFIALATIMAVARIYTQIKMKGKTQADDGMIILAVIFQWVWAGMVIAGVDSGDGRHSDTLSPERRYKAVELFVFSTLPGLLGLALPKLAVVAMVCRLLLPTQWHRAFLWSLVVFNIIVFVGVGVLVMVPWFTYAPRNMSWDPWLTIHYYMGAAAFSAFVDLYLAVYPTVVLFKLNICLKKKLLLSVMLGFGAIAAVVSINKNARLTVLASADWTYDTAELIIWTNIEGSAMIMAACIPFLQPLYYITLGRRSKQIPEPMAKSVSDTNPDPELGSIQPSDSQKYGVQPNPQEENPKYKVSAKAKTVSVISIVDPEITFPPSAVTSPVTVYHPHNPEYQRARRDSMGR